MHHCYPSIRSSQTGRTDLPVLTIQQHLTASCSTSATWRHIISIFGDDPEHYPKQGKGVLVGVGDRDLALDFPAARGQCRGSPHFLQHMPRCTPNQAHLCNKLHGKAKVGNLQSGKYSVFSECKSTSRRACLGFEADWPQLGLR